MFIRKTKTRSVNGTDYFSYRLVRNARVDGRVKQIALLNLGAQFDLPPALWLAFCARISDLLSPQASLSCVALDPLVESTAQRFSALLLPASATGQGAVQRPHLTAQSTATRDALGATQADLFAPSSPVFAAVSPAPARAPQWVDADSLDHLDVRSIGVETVAMHAINQLGIVPALRAAGFNSVDLAAAIGQLVARMAAPASERRTHAWLQQHSALSEVYGFDYGRLSLTRLYQVGSALWKVRPVLEKTLYDTLKSQLKLTDTIALYDLTNTYFEGLGKRNPLALRGASKEGRTDAPLMSLGIVLDAHGFIQKSDVFAGNIREPATLAGMLKGLGAAPGALVVLDRGFVNKATLSWLRENGYRYLVMSKDRRDLSAAAGSIQNAQGQAIQIERILVKIEADKVEIKPSKTAVDATPTEPIHEGSNGTQTDSKLTDSKLTEPSIQEAHLICHSPARAEKESAMVSRMRSRFEAKLAAIKKGLTTPRGTKRSNAIHQRIGRAKAGFPMVARHYTITVTEDGKTVSALDYAYQASQQSKADLPGHYVLRSNDLKLSAEQMWRTYIQLTDVESVFRSLKSELGLRPVFHQLPERCKAHLWISVLAYQCVQYLRNGLKKAGIADSWSTLRTQLGAHHRVWSRLERKAGGHVHVEQNQQASAEVKAIFRALGVQPLAKKSTVVHRTSL